MARGTVSVNNLNLTQGEFPEIERKLLFIGVGANDEYIGTTLSLSSESDFDALLGEADSPLKTNLEAARLNAGQNWFAWALPIASNASSADTLAAFDVSMEQYFKSTTPEGVVVVREAETEDEVSDWHEKVMQWLGSHGRQLFAMVAVPGIDAETQTWAEYELAMSPKVADIAGNRAMPVPQLHGNNIGVLAGRLCNRSTSIADTPMRVETGAVLGLGDDPVDMDGVPLPESTLVALDQMRYSVPQHYADYPGTYWADGNMLEVPAGDYQVIEYLRPVLKACREVRVLAIARVGDRKFNDTPESIAYHKTYFARPLREMSRSTTIQIGDEELVMVGDIMPPGKDAITIQWISKSKVRIYIKVRPYNAPKDIEANIVLDLSV